MKRILAAAILLFTAFSCNTYIAFASCAPDEYTQEERKKFLNDAAAYEKAGRFIEALEGYYDAYLACDKNDPLSISAMEGAKRVGYKLGEQEEKKSNFYAGGHKNGIGAFEWFEASRHFADSDRVMMKLARNTADDANFSNIVTHFKNRNYNIESFKEKSPGYVFDTNYLKELENEASKRGDAALSKENEAFGKAQKTGGPERYQESLELLRVAGRWFNTVKGQNEKKASDQAEKRGDALLSNQDPPSLETAINYYVIFYNSEKIKKVKAKADLLGDSSFKKGDYKNAVEYYGISDNHSKRKEAMKLFEKQEKEEEKARESKEQRRQEEFKKGQDTLEEELGL